MRTKGKYFFFILPLLLQQCAPSRFVKPLAKNEKAVSFSFGGPLIKYSGAATPLPFSTLAFGYGLNDRCTAFGSIHSTSLLFGNLQTDIGANFLLSGGSDRKWGLSTAPALQLAYAMGIKNSARLWPSLDLNFFKHFGDRKSYLYGGASSWFELSTRRSNGLKQKRHVIPNLQLGYVFARKKWDHQFELKYLGAGIPNLPNVVDYIGPAHKGTLGIYYSIIRRF